MTTTLLSTTEDRGQDAPSCERCAIRAHCLSANLRGNDLSAFQNSRTQMRIVQKGESLFRAGDDFDALYMVRSGTVKVSADCADGVEQIAGFYLPGGLVGLDGIESRVHVNSAEALETCSVCVFPFTTLMNLAQSLVTLQDRLWMHASHEISTRQRLLMSIGRRSAEARIADFLLSMSSQFERFGYSGVNFRLPMSRQDIAAYVGLSVETVCRVLTRFQEVGLIQREQREIRLNDAKGLIEIIEGVAPERETNRDIRLCAGHVTARRRSMEVLAAN